ncbi:hypothetical protein KKD61_00430, partial [Patescibacteria group bacterium]|nr:hypothetical protein [Patescibacteria group bacterium]
MIAKLIIKPKVFHRSPSSGQVALIILTVMATALTLGLSMSERVLTDLRISEQNQESTRAFSAAEAGVEEALRVIREGGVTSDIDISDLADDLGVDEVTIDSTTIGGTDQFSFSQSFQSGEIALIWLRNHDANGDFDEASGYDDASVDLCWENEAALEAVYFYRSGGSYGVRRFTFDPVADRRDFSGGAGTGNHFSPPTGAGCAGMNLSGTVDLSAETPLFLVVKPFYQETRIGVLGLSPLPVQGYEVTSAGSITQNTQEKISRKVKA